MAEKIGLLSAVDSQFDGKQELPSPPQRVRNGRNKQYTILYSIIAISFVTNLTLLNLWIRERQAAQSCELPLSGSRPTEHIDFGEKSAWGDASNLTALDELWLSMDVNAGVVALSNDLHLGSTDPFPWDDSKGLYVLNSYHSLHCLQGIYGFARNAEANRTQTQTLEHVVHCLDVLRAEVMCTADETPLSFRFQEVNPKEKPPKRKCRSWDALTHYATQHSACFHRYSPEDPRYETLDEFTYCPPESPYRALVDKIQGKNGT